MSVSPEVWSFLSERTTCFVVKPNTVITRCPYCGDSRRKLHNYGHLYISLEIPGFICFRCNEKGHIKKLLSKFIECRICTVDEAKRVLNAYHGKSSKVSFASNSDKLQYDRIETNLTDKQRLYLLDRVGKELDWSSYKIASVGWLIDNSNFMSIDNPIIHRMHRDRDFLSYVANNYVAFISLLDTVIILRNVSNQEPRYIQVYTNNHDPYDVYVANPNYNSFKLSQAKNYVIAEGVFDVLNQRVKFNTDNSYCKIAVFGKVRLFKAKTILQSFFSTIQQINVYVDKDLLNDKFHLRLLKYELSEFPVRFFYNKVGKDMGEKKVVLQEAF